MRKEEFLRALSKGLAELGWAAKHVKRTARETSDHWDDLEAEAREDGLDAAAASRSTNERIGEADSLIRLHHETMRKATWSGRHPVMSFALMPPLLLIVWFVTWSLMAFGAGEIYSKLLALSEPIWRSHLLVLIWATVIHYTGVIVVPAIAWSWAQRSFCGRKWGWIACGVCALHGLLNRVAVQPNSLHFGYGIAPPDWLPVIAPLVVGTLAHWYSRANVRKVVAALLLATFVTGCASSKQPRERGWIGGEYKRTAAGLLITRLSTNSPAARSGLREGDLVLHVDGKRVKNLRAFQERIDAANPGTSVSIEVARDGEHSERNIVVGSERYKPDRSITVGVLLAREWDLWPNPGFSLIALGYKRQDHRVELDSPESRFDLARRDEENSKGLRSREGWEVWLPVFSFSQRKRILAQTLGE
jgi:PDZ domain